GCDRRCSYCAVSSLRGVSVSRDFDDAVAEAARIVAGGTSEIILTGVQLGGYESSGATLADLVAGISRVPGLKRLRLGSVEPFSLTGELMAAMKDSETFCPHLHLPLQSGDNGVLGAMRRGYSASDFAEAVAMTKQYLGDDVHISTDLIVGFPGENEAAFERSLSLLESLALGKIHVFPYSPRSGTDSAAMERLPPVVVSERTDRALALADKLLSEYAARMVGRADSVLVENAGRGTASGWSRHYLRVYLQASDTRKNLIGNEFSVCPKISIGSILLCEGVDKEKIIIDPDE
ncbi:MAG: radical SAM protein, partial [Synergistaceae bacterium]|nr:radical SAM protein [Synergistaceae bacterium]